DKSTTARVFPPPCHSQPSPGPGKMVNLYLPRLLSTKFSVVIAVYNPADICQASPVFRVFLLTIALVIRFGFCYLSKYD
ncbi:MAG: hypothetical protein JSU79_09710, partial [Dehalococcoidales bacterium]